jgi:hypothetical protein
VGWSREHTARRGKGRAWGLRELHCSLSLFREASWRARRIQHCAAGCCRQFSSRVIVSAALQLLELTLVQGWSSQMVRCPRPSADASTMTEDLRRATSLLGNTDVAIDASSFGKGMNAVAKVFWRSGEARARVEDPCSDRAGLLVPLGATGMTIPKRAPHPTIRNLPALASYNRNTANVDT